MTKTCTKCHQEKEHKVYTSGKVEWICVDCRRIYSNHHYEKAKKAGTRPTQQPDYRRAAVTKNREKRREMIKEIKESSACMDCGVSYPYWVMDFDHREDETKVATVQKLLKSGPIASVLTEIEKCDLVCSNCHRTRTYLRMKEKN